MSRHTAFDPLRDGFRFVNCFDFAWPWSRQPVASLGLCGGMCFAALDHWRTGQPIPAQETPPGQGSALYRYLVRRQIVSMYPLMLARLVRRVLADQATNDRLTLAAWPGILKSIDAGSPVVLALVRSQGWGNPTDNHQVLCSGYDLDQRTGELELAIYDPIYPCERVWLHLRLIDPAGQTDLRHSRGDRVRGLFVSRYRSAVPPANL